MFIGDFNVDSFLHGSNQNVEVPEKLLFDADITNGEQQLGRQLPDTRPTM